MLLPAGRDTTQRGPKDRKRFRVSAAIILLLLGMITTAPAYAEDADEPDPGEGETAHQESHSGRSSFMGFAGWSHKDSGKDSVTYGMDYAYRFSKRLGVGVFLEMSAGQFEADTAGISFGGYPTERLYLFVATGIERTLFAEKERVLRAGLSYGFPVASVELKPLAWVDSVDGHKIYFLGFGVERRF